MGNSRARNPISSYSGTQTSELTRRKKILFGEKEHLIQVVMSCQNHMALMVPAESKGQVDAFVAELERAKAAAG